MSRGRMRSPNIFHPEKPSAVGSRNSMSQEGREQDNELKMFVDESTEKIVHHVLNKLPPDATKNLEVMGSVKEKLYNYVNQSYQNMFNRYLTTVEDEMAKKVRDLVDKEELRASNKYSPREVAELLDQIGGADKFNTGELEKSAVNIYGHLHGHLVRGMTDLEQETNSLLRQKTDVGAFVRGQNFYAVVKCAFKDHPLKPKTVMNVKLSINVLDRELISPIYHHQWTVEYIVKELITTHILGKLDAEIEKINNEMIDQGKSELSDTEEIIAKMNSVEKHTSDDRDDEKSKRYTYIAKHLMERIEGLRAEINPKDYDALNVRENIKKVFDEEGIRIRGFNTAINNLTSILDTSKLGYQYCENMKNVREFLIREYEDTNEAELPDERYQMLMKYYDQNQVLTERIAYDKQMQGFDMETRLAADIAESIVQEHKKYFILNDWSDLVVATRGWRKKHIKEGETLYEENPKEWDEVNDIQPEETDVEKQNRTYNYQKLIFNQRLNIALDKMKQVHKFQYPKKRILIEERIHFLKKKLADFDYRINPYHMQAGLLLDINLTTSKRKRFIMHGMANVLNEFLSSVSKGFEDAAFATFSRRRSTVREDIDQKFFSAEELEAAEEIEKAKTEGRKPRLDKTAEETPAEKPEKPSGRRGKGSAADGDLEKL